MKKTIFYFCVVLVLSLIGCGKEESRLAESESTEQVYSENNAESILQDAVVNDAIANDATTEDITMSGALEENEDAVMQAPSKEEVLAMRATVLEGMTEEEIVRLTENIKVANLQMERGYLNDNLFEKLADAESPYWQYFDQEGDIQLGWWYHGAICSMDAIMRAEGITEEEFYETYDEPGIVYNRFDGENFANLIEDMMGTVQNENLRADLQHLIDLTNLAVETHDVQYANEIYQILHDMDYFLLRYGIDDVGVYVSDQSLIRKYYGVLTVYGEE